MFLPAGDNKHHCKQAPESKTADISAEWRGIKFGMSVALPAFMQVFSSAHSICFAAFGEAHTAASPPVILISS